MIDASEMIDRHYRYSVKCGREMAKAIDKAAKADGLSAESFVQRHFERILAEPRPAPAETLAAPVLSHARHDFDKAKSLGITVTMLRLYRAMAAARDGNGHVRMSQLALAEMAGIASASVTNFRKKLEQRGLIRLVVPAAHRTPAVYHVATIGDEA